MVILPDFKSPADINKRKTQTYASTKPKGHKLDVTKITVLFIAKSHSISVFLFTFLITRFIKIYFIPILQEYRHFLHNIRLANNVVKRYLLFFFFNVYVPVWRNIWKWVVPFVFRRVNFVKLFVFHDLD